MIPFPYSLAVLPLVLVAAWAYLALGAWSGVTLRRGARAVLLAVACTLPVLTSGPGPVQLTLGLVVGYLGIRAVALGGARRQRGPASPPADALRALLSVDHLLCPVLADPARRLPRALALGLLGVAACVALLVVGDRVQLWRWSRYLDALLVCLEVAVGAAGLNNLILAAAAARGRSVAGLQERPALSASLGEFWTVRWNHLVQPNLDRGFFRPLSRRRHPAAGVVAAFTAAGAMHVLPVLTAGPLVVTLIPATSVMAFFLLHAGLVLGERAVGWRRLPPPGPALTRARLRTVILFALLSPLMLGPFADVTHVHGRVLAQNFNETPAVP